MKYVLRLLITLVFISCDNISEEKTQEIDKEFEEIESSSVSSSMTFFDNDSIYDTYFKSISKNDGEELKWEINIYERDSLTATIHDSLNSMSYLVEAVDLNRDNQGELVFVTGKFHHAFENTETIRCTIYVYAKIRNKWTRLLTPDLTEEQKIGYFGNEVVSIENGNVIRKYSIFNDNKKESGKDRVLTYGMDDKNNIIIIKEEIKDANNS